MQIEDFFFSFFPPDWFKYRYSQLTKVLDIILVCHWKGLGNKRTPNKKSSEPGRCGSGRTRLAQSLCCCGSGGTCDDTDCLQPEFWWMPLPAGAAAEIVGWWGVACKSVPQGMGDMNLLFIASFYQRQKFVSGYRVCNHRVSYSR